MIAKVEAKRLYNCLSALPPARSWEPPFAKLARMDAAEGKLRISAANGELEITQTINAVVEKDGSTSVSREKLSAIARGAEEIRIEEGPDGISVRTEKAEFFLYKPESDPPEPQEPTPSRGFILSGREIKRLLGKCLPFANPDRTALSTVFLEIKDQKAISVATDRQRFLAVKAELAGQKKEGTMALPSPAVRALLNMIDEEEEIEIKETKNHFEFIGRGFLIRAAKTQAEPPDYQQAIVENLQYAITTERTRLLDALKDMKILAGGPYVRVVLTPDGKKLELSIENPQAGIASESIRAECPNETPAAGYNVNSLLDAVEAIEEGDITLSFESERSAARIQGSTDSVTAIIAALV